MKRAFVILLFAVAVLMVGGLSMATAGPPTTLTWGTVLPAQTEAVAEPAAVPPKAEAVTPTPAAKPLLLTKAGKPVRWQDRRQRRKLGLSIGGIRAKLRKLSEAGELDELRNSKGRITLAAARDHAPRIAAQLLGLAQEQNPRAFSQYVQGEVSAERDWSGFFAALMAFLEAFLPFILMFM